MHGEYYNNFFDTSIPFDAGIVKINDFDNGKSLLNFLDTPHDICNYCKQYLWALDEQRVVPKKWERYNNNDIPREEDWF